MRQANRTAQPSLSQLYRYPIKGLTPEPLPSIQLIAGENMPFDRAYAIENGPGRFDPAAPRHLPKITFLMLMRNERLAQLRATLDPASQHLTLRRDGHVVVAGDLTTATGRASIEAYLAAEFKGDLRGPPRIVQAPGFAFTDVPAKCVHVINLASVRELESKIGRSVDPLRFRANLHLDGLAPFEEFQWLDRTLTFSGGVQLRVFDRTVRCAATEVDPATGQRDISMLSQLRQHLGHNDFGVYAKVVAGGPLAQGETLSVS